MFLWTHQSSPRGSQQDLWLWVSLCCPAGGGQGGKRRAMFSDLYSFCALVHKLEEAGPC